MKKPAFLFLLLFFTPQLFSQELLRNPATPLNRDAFRILRYEKTWEVSSSSGGFSFQSPTMLMADQNGFLYILARNINPPATRTPESQGEVLLMKFSPDGQFLGNVLKAYPDPDEFLTQAWAEMVVSADGVSVNHGSRVIHFDRNGKFTGETVRAEKTPAGHPRSVGHLLGATAEGLLINDIRRIVSTEASGIENDEEEIDLLTRDGASLKRICGFPSRHYMVKNENNQGYMGFSLDPFLTAFDPVDGSLYVSHTGEYQVVKIDTATRQVVLRFGREYPRVVAKEPQQHKEIIERYNPPLKQFEHDISAMFPVDGNLWVVTSTRAPNGAPLVDVFDGQGAYIDSFFIDPPLGRFYRPAPGGYLCVLNRGRERNWVVAKFKILNGPKAAS